MNFEIDFLGAADTVTGSRHLVHLGDDHLLLDCGMFQGFKAWRERNWLAPSSAMLGANAVLLSHAHLDHSGWLPVLVQHGFKGPIYASRATRDLAEVLLLDSAHLQEEDARRANRYGYSKHAQAMPLYTRRQAQAAIARIVPVAENQAILVGKTTVTFSPAGHLLGACSIHLAQGPNSLLYSGDLGRQDDLLMPPPASPLQADVLLMESTYGNRQHPITDAAAALAGLIDATVRRGGSVLMPTFAVGRAQALLLVLQRLKRRGLIPTNLPIFLDSPMAQQATALYRQYARQLRVPAREMRTLVEDVRIVTTAAQSIKLAQHRFPCVILSASGMATGGRVLHHLKAMAPQAKHTVVFAGFQVAGSRGAKLVDGATEVKVHGESVPVRAQIAQLEGFSGHADAKELVAWAGAMPKPPQGVFVVHGEAAAADALRSRLSDELRWPARVPQQGEHVTLA
jgi:metallo-beta-lactamase family protein